MRWRRIAWALIAYGLSGLALLIIVASVGLDAANRVERVAASADSALDSAAITAASLVPGGRRLATALRTCSEPSMPSRAR